MRFLMLLVLLICFFGLSDINAAKAGWASNNNNSTSSVVNAQDVQYMRGIVQSILITDSKAMVEQALKSEDFRVKAAGCVLARRCGKEYLEELFDGLVDDNDLVRQVCRESLHILNYMMTKKEDRLRAFARRTKYC